MTNLPERPSWPTMSLIEESDTASLCSECGSSRYKVWIFFRTKYCIQPKCKNYWETENDKK